MASSLTKAEMLVNTVLPQIVAQLESVSTFGSTTSETDVGSIKVAQVTYDRFLRNVHEIAIAEDLIPVFSDLLAMAFGDNFNVSTDFCAQVQEAQGAGARRS